MFVSDDHEMMMVATLTDDDDFISFPTEEDIVKERKMRMKSLIEEHEESECQLNQCCFCSIL